MIKAKKSLGQNFLIDKKILEKITSIENIEDKTAWKLGLELQFDIIYIKKPRKFL